MSPNGTVTATATNVLGTLVMYEIKEAIAVAHPALKQMWSTFGLDPALCPKPRSGRDAFRKATPRRKLREGLMLSEYKGKATLPNISMACVLVRATPTKTKVRLIHANRAVVGLKDDDTLEITPYQKLDPHEEQYLGEVADIFQRSKAAIDGSQIREAVAKILKRVHAVQFRDGAYLIPATQDLTTQGVLSLFNALGDGVKVHHIAYVDTPSQRVQLRDVIADHVKREIEAKIIEATNYVRRRQGQNKTVGDGKKTTMLGEMLALEGLIGDYEQVMRESFQELKLQRITTDELISQILDADV